jgi:hypothetical protein
MEGVHLPDWDCLEIATKQIVGLSAHINGTPTFNTDSFARFFV